MTRGGIARARETFTPWRAVGIGKGQNEATPNGCGNRESKVFSGSCALIITFALTDERQRCCSGGCERSALCDTTMRDYCIPSDGRDRAGGIAA